MRLLLIFLFVFICNNVFTQYNYPDSTFLSTMKDRSNRIEATTQSGIVIRCAATNFNNEPLVVIDGLPVEYERVSRLDPKDIESIEVLKEETAQALFGCRAARGVIIIATKHAKLREFIIKDFLDGSLVPGATISFISKEEKDTLVFVADDNGKVITDKIKYGNNYKVEVSSVGYKTLSVGVTKNKSQQLLLDRDFKENGEVVVVASGFNCVRRRIICCSLWRSALCSHVTNENAKDEDNYSLYPNPVQRGGTVTINLKNETGDQVNIRVINLMGQPLLSQSKQLIKGNNTLNVRADARWAAGTYIVHLTDRSGKVLKSEKLIIQ